MNLSIYEFTDPYIRNMYISHANLTKHISTYTFIHTYRHPFSVTVCRHVHHLQVSTPEERWVGTGQEGDQIIIFNDDANA